MEFQDFADALKNMPTDQPFSRITVEELANACHLDTASFYDSFDDIYELVHWILEQESVTIKKQYALFSDLEDMIYFTVDYVQKNPHIRRCILDACGREELTWFLISNLRDAVKQTVSQASQKLTVSEEYKKFLTDFYTEALAGSLGSYFRRNSGDSLYNVEKYAHYLAVTLHETVFSALQGAAVDKNHKKRR